MRIRTQFIMTMFLFGIVLAAISASVIITNHEVEDAYKQQEIAGDIAQGASELSYLSNDYVINRESQQLERWQARFASFSRDVDRLQAGKPEHLALVRNIKANARRLKEVFDSVVSGIGIRAPNENETVNVELLRVSWSRMAVQSQGLASDAARLSFLLVNRANQLQRTNTIVVTVLIGVFFAYFLLNYVMMQRRALKGIAALQAGTSVIGSGDLDFRFDERRTDEIGDLSRAFNRMAADLKSVTASKADLEKEMTARKRAAEALVASERKYRELIETANSIIIRWDNKGIVRFINDYGLRFFGYSPGEFLGRDVMTIVPEVEQSTGRDLEGLVRDIVKHPELYASVQSENIRKDGKTIWVAWTNKAILDEHGKVQEILAIGNDINALKESEAALRESRAKLETSLAEKEVLLKEIHHRVKNNMQVISSLVALQADESKDTAIRDVLQDVSHRVRSMAMVHEKLYQSADLAKVDFAEYAQSLINYLWRSYRGEVSGLRFSLDLESVSLPVNEAVPCGLILNELITNALKHAFPCHREGEVAVSLHGDEQGRRVLCVRDNGKGLPDGLDWRRAHSLGLRLVQMLAGQLHATVEVSSAGGTEFKVFFKRPNL